MSLAVAAIKIAALRSLKGCTSAGDAVFDSAVEPFDALRDHGAPVVVIYCDAGKRDVQGRDLFGARQVIDLAFDMFVAQAVTVDAGETEDPGLRRGQRDISSQPRLRGRKSPAVRPIDLAGAVSSAMVPCLRSGFLRMGSRCDRRQGAPPGAAASHL